MALNRKIYYIGIILALIILAIIFCLPLILPLDTIVVEESYLQFCSFEELNIIHLLKDHTIPLWAYHFGGGYPFIKYPDNISLSPLFYLLVLPFGSANGTKALLIFSYIIGILGIFLLARRVLKYNLFACAITTMFFIFNSFIPFQINTGNVKDQGWLYLPLLAYSLISSRENRRHIFYCAALIVLVLLNGFGLYLAPMLLFLFLFAFCFDTPQLKSGLPYKNSLLVNFLLIITIAFFLGAMKILPTLELMKVNIRTISDYQQAQAEAMTWPKMIAAFFSRGPYAVSNEANMGKSGLGMGAVMYFGIIPGLLFLASCIFCFKKIWKYLLLAAVFIILSMANHSPLDLFYPLWHLPLFHSMHQVVRYFSFPVVLMISIIAGAFFSCKVFRNSSKQLKIVICCVALIGAADMFMANRQYYKFSGFYQEPLPKMQLDKPFFNVLTVEGAYSEQPVLHNENQRWIEKYDDEMPLGLQYFLLRQNIGLINWYGNIKIAERAIPKYFVTLGYGHYWRDFRGAIASSRSIRANPHYRGEAAFTKHRKNIVQGITWKTNEIIVDIRQTQADTLIINQNYDREWQASIGEVFDAQGLLAIKLEQPVKGQLRLRYHPQSFYLGLIVSGICAVLCLLLMLRLSAGAVTAKEVFE